MRFLARGQRDVGVLVFEGGGGGGNRPGKKQIELKFRGVTQPEIQAIAISEPGGCLSAEQASPPMHLREKNCAVVCYNCR